MTPTMAAIATAMGMPSQGVSPAKFQSITVT